MHSLLSFAQKFYGKIALFIAILIVPSVLTHIIISSFNKSLKNNNLIPDSFSLRKHLYSPIWASIFLLLIKFISPAFFLTGVIDKIADKSVNILLIVVITWLLVRFATLIKKISLHKFDISTTDNLRHRKILTQVDYLEKFLIVFFIVIAVCAVLMSFEGARKIGTSLIASAGIAGVIVGFAAQKSLSNLIAGFQIAFTQPFRIDDIVVVDGEWGRIEEITLTYVVIKLWDLRRLVVPINYLLEKPFENWTRSTAKILAHVFLYTDYNLKVDELRNEVSRVLNETDLWDKETVSVQVVDTTEQAIKIRILMSAENAAKAWDLKCMVRERLIEFIQQNYPEALPKSRISAFDKEI